MQIKEGITINSLADFAVFTDRVIRKNKRNSSHVAVRQEVDETENQPNATMAVKTYYYRINFFFQFDFGESSFLLANANELKSVVEHQALENLDLKSKYLFFKLTNLHRCAYKGFFGGFSCKRYPISSRSTYYRNGLRT